MNFVTMVGRAQGFGGAGSRARLKHKYFSYDQITINLEETALADSRGTGMNEESFIAAFARPDGVVKPFARRIGSF
jgi:hypothetical protein